jgi:hypothetical protein
MTEDNLWLWAGVGLIAALWPGLAASAQTYVCTTPDGRHLSGDQPPAECSVVEVTILGRDGAVRGSIPSPHQLRAREQEAARAAEAAQDRAATRALDRALLERYASVEDIEVARARALAPVRASLAKAEAALSSLARERDTLATELEFYQGRPVPARTQFQVDANQSLLAQQNRVKAELDQELARLNAKFDQDVERYSKLSH